MIHRDRLGLGNVKSRSRDDSRPKRFGERVAVHDRPARRIHKDGRRLHPSEHFGINQVVSRGIQPDVEGYEVSSCN
jgi:hypothetical protein